MDYIKSLFSCRLSAQSTPAKIPAELKSEATPVQAEEEALRNSTDVSSDNAKDQQGKDKLSPGGSAIPISQNEGHLIKAIAMLYSLEQSNRRELSNQKKLIEDQNN